MMDIHGDTILNFLCLLWNVGSYNSCDSCHAITLVDFYVSRQELSMVSPELAELELIILINLQMVFLLAIGISTVQEFEA
jgi:hypothetical protein